ncbi:MAG: ATP-binding protein [Clostridia bacterium]|nr:ATP-binding protein [Clostridia bacterium]
MRKRIIGHMILLVLFTVLVLAAFIIPRVTAAFEAQAYGALKNAAGVLAASLDEPPEQPPEQSIDVIAALRPIRVTWIAPDGSILYESNANPAEMENHGDRIEVIQAIQHGEGQDSRLSRTLNRRTYYYAQHLADGSVLRVSDTRQTVLGALLDLIPALILSFIVVMVLGALIASKLTALLVRPIDTLDLENPAENDVYEELTPLLTRLQAQNQRIDNQLHAIKSHGRAFDTITGNMAEGLVVLAADGTVLSINRSAARLFDAGADAVAGRHYMALARDLPMHDAVKLTLSGSTAEARLERNGRFYQLLANPVLMEGVPSGAILLLLDVTEREQAEETRREFSANVSHELKTPLTSIAGYAEMLAAGMVQPDDIPEAVGKIHAEARRMITLIEDILALSKLDEGQAPAPKEQVGLLSLARDVSALLSAAADAQQVSIMVDGEEAIVSGVRSILEEMLFNLMENSIKYNKPGGKVCVGVQNTGEGITVTVADTGVGIAPEHQERVFERFYRVDKSHSRSTGGTGLGLSIVKHGALLHEAKVALKSTVGEGTEIKVAFLH